MDIFNLPTRIIITCNNRLTPYLDQEVRDLGFQPERTFTTGVELKGSLSDCIRLNLNLRCASQVLFSLMEFQANSPDEIYEELIRFAWEDILNVDGYFSVTSNATHFTVNNDMFINVKVKDGIADRMRREKLKRPDSGPDLSKTVIHLYWKENRAEFFWIPLAKL
jgi:Predicted N6-adenine-specific DNA methylase